MNAQEKTALQDFLQEMNRVRLERKDLEADAMIRQAAQQQPDALYLLTQRALLQEQALQNAQQQIAELRKQMADLQTGATGGGSFLDSSSQWGRSGQVLGTAVQGGQAINPGMNPGMNPAAAASSTQAQSQPSQTQPPVGARPGLFGGGGGTFLGSMAGMLAGAAAGSFLYQGIGHLLHPNGPQSAAQNLGDLNQGQQGAQGGNLASDNPLARDAGVNDVGASTRSDLSQLEDGASGQDDWSDSADGSDFFDGDDLA